MFQSTNCSYKYMLVGYGGDKLNNQVLLNDKVGIPCL